MKKIILLIVLTTFILGCSSGSSNDNIDLGYMKFELQNTFNFSDEDVFVGTQWSEYINNNGTVTHTISSSVSRVGDNPLFSQDFIDFRFNFTVSGPLTVNQIIPINSIVFENSLPYNNNNYDITDLCSILHLVKQNTTTGFVKITQIDNENGYLKGVFEFNGLKNNGGTNIQGNPCQNYPSQQNYNIINGQFYAYN